jgi:hypothetical protein
MLLQQFICFTSTKVQILTPAAPAAVAGQHAAAAAAAAAAAEGGRERVTVALLVRLLIKRAQLLNKPLVCFLIRHLTPSGIRILSDVGNSVC